MRLVSVAMTNEEAVHERRRRGHWLRLARVEANLNQNEVARRLGLGERSGTTILAWEKGRRDPRSSHLRQLAALYGVPIEKFADPEPTDVERLIEWRAELARAAIELAHEDLARDMGAGPSDEAPPDEQPRRRSA